MNAFEFGKYISTSRGIQRALTGVSTIYSGQGAVRSLQFTAGALSPFVGTALGTVAAVGAAVYGGKQIYDGIKELF
jgi:hypothetical protein